MSVSICEQLHNRLGQYCNNLDYAMKHGEYYNAMYCIGIIDACDGILQALSGEEYFKDNYVDAVTFEASKKIIFKLPLDKVV